MQYTALVPLLATLAAAQSPYKPTTTACEGNGNLAIRDSNTDLGADEAAYLVGRKPKADAALKAWLDKQSPGLGSNSATVPTLGLSISGGAWRSMLIGAGVMQAMDDREETQTSLSGLLQAMTYHIGVSGGGWLVASWAGNNFPTITKLKQDLWLEALDDGLALPGGTWDALSSFETIAGDVSEKMAAGYPVSLTDIWSRLLSYQFLPGDDGGVAIKMSDVAGYSNMTEFNVPIPIFNMNGVDVAAGACNPLDNGTVFEANPWEFGSWDDSVSGWIPMKHLGTTPSDTECTVGFDNLGHLLGMGSSLFGMKACVADDPMADVMPIIEKVTSLLHELSEDLMFGMVPNPFEGFNGQGEEAAEVFAVDELYMVDGGILTHNTPVAPLLEPARDVSVVFVIDSSADTGGNMPNGSDLIMVQDYVNTIPRLANRLPKLPNLETFISSGFDKRAVFFGCDEPEVATIIYVPNYNFTWDSGYATAKFQYDKDVTEGMIANGVAVGTQNGDTTWGLCLACGIMQKEEGAVLPTECDACFDSWCYREAPSKGTETLGRRSPVSG